jgi:hypothetical protein
VTDATRSWAISSGGRSSVLSGTSTAPTRITASAAVAQIDAVRHQQPDAIALVQADRTSRPASARLASSSSAHVIRLSSLTSACTRASAPRRSLITRGIVSSSPSIGEQSLEPGPIELALGSSGIASSGSSRKRRGTLYEDRRCASRSRSARPRRRDRRHAHRRCHQLTARVVRDADHVGDEPEEILDRSLDLARRDVWRRSS